MKQFIVDRHTTPSTPALKQVPTEKIPIYATDADAEADLANLAEGQIIATLDTGDELSNPVDAVESGNLHAVTSNAVAGRCPRFPDYARGNLISGTMTSYTTTEDCYVVFTFYTQSSTIQGARLTINGVIVSGADSSSINNMGSTTFAGYVKKGSILSRSDNGSLSDTTLKVFGLI